jgi:hypothetical protein
MSKLFKLIFLALLSAFIIGCGHHSGGSSSKSDNTTLGDDNTSTIDDNSTKDDNGTTDDNNTTEDNLTAIEKFVSDFPAFDAGGKTIINSYMSIRYKNISEDEAKAVNTTLTGVKDFTYDDYSDDYIILYVYYPNYDITDKNLTSADAEIFFYNDEWTSQFFLDAANRTIAYSEPDDIFGAVNASISSVEFEINNGDDVDMSAEHAAYYHQLLDSGVFEEADCYSDDDTSWSCYKGDGTFYYAWDASKNYFYWYKGTTEP